MLIKGVQVQLGSEEVILPPFSLRTMFDHEDVIRQLQDPSKLSLLEYVKLSAPIVLETLQRNYPDMTEADFMARADPTSMMQMLELSFAQSGFVPLLAGAPTAESESAPAAQTSSDS